MKGVNVPLINIVGVPLTEKDTRQHLATIMRLMGIGYEGFMFHGFHRTGATIALGQQVPLDIIKAPRALAIRCCLTSPSLWQKLSPGHSRHYSCRELWSRRHGCLKALCTVKSIL